jgi:adenosylmethionine-8-amino-7-oxononanoate aminotransferase
VREVTTWDLRSVAEACSKACRAWCCHARGVLLKPHGDRLRVMPASAVTPDEIQALRQLKPEVLSLLTGAEPGAEVLRHALRHKTRIIAVER